MRVASPNTGTEFEGKGMPTLIGDSRSSTRKKIESIGEGGLKTGLGLPASTLRGGEARPERAPRKRGALQKNLSKVGLYPLLVGSSRVFAVTGVSRDQSERSAHSPRRHEVWGEYKWCTRCECTNELGTTATTAVALNRMKYGPQTDFPC